MSFYLIDLIKNSLINNKQKIIIVSNKNNNNSKKAVSQRLRAYN